MCGSEEANGLSWRTFVKTDLLGCVKYNKIPVFAGIVPDSSHISHKRGKCTTKEKTGIPWWSSG